MFNCIKKMGLEKFIKDMDVCSVDEQTLSAIVAPFKPDEVGLIAAWDEFYLACQAADASPELLQAIHDIKEAIEDAETEGELCQ